MIPGSQPRTSAMHLKLLHVGKLGRSWVAAEMKLHVWSLFCFNFGCIVGYFDVLKTFMGPRASWAQEWRYDCCFWFVVLFSLVSRGSVPAFQPNATRWGWWALALWVAPRGVHLSCGCGGPNFEARVPSTFFTCVRHYTGEAMHVFLCIFIVGIEDQRRG